MLDQLTSGTDSPRWIHANTQILKLIGLARLHEITGDAGHALGTAFPHGVRVDTTPLATGIRFSNEPMIVIPDRFGIRLEDHFYMAEGSPRWFTKPQVAIDAPFG